MLRSLFRSTDAQLPKEDVNIALPGVTVIFQHRLRICFLYSMDSATQPDTFSALEMHLAKQGYLLVVIVAPPGIPMPTPQDFSG